MKSEKFTFTKRKSFGRFIKMSMLSALLTIWYSGLQAQCPLACNNLVQVSLDDDCDVTITYQMMLEGEIPTCSPGATVEILGVNGQILSTSPRVTRANIGQTLTVRIRYGANSCWGKIKIEDKLAPVITCPPVDTLGCYDERVISKPVATDNCRGSLPGDWVSVLSDSTIDQSCASYYRAIRHIRYQARDSVGNLSEICRRTVYYRRITLDSVHIPKNYDGLPGHRPVLECDGTWLWNPNPTANWDKNGNNYPDPDETGAPFVRDSANISGYINGFIVTVPPMGGGCVAGTIVRPEEEGAYRMLGCDLANFRIDTFYNPFIGSNNLCKINTAYSDTKLDICPKSFKVLRAWTILDWCSGLIKTGHQVIKVVDSKGPVVTIPSDVTTAVTPCVAAISQSNTTGVTTANVSAVIPADPYSCTGTWLASIPTIVYDCNDVTYEVEFALAEANGLPAASPVYTKLSGLTRSTRLASGRWELAGLPLGCTWVRYTLKDACGNISYGFTEIRVVDTTPPVPVCDEFTVVTLTNNGEAIIFAETFDDGSHDNCTDVIYHVKRDGSCAGTTPPYTVPTGFTDPGSDGFGDFVRFCCNDVGRQVMVQLRVTDRFGNVNTCMVNVTTQDKVPPFIKCPADKAIDCGADTSLLVSERPVFSATPLSTPYYTDNCPNPTWSYSTSGKLDNCGQGVLTKTFTVRDGGGRTHSCTQTITVRNMTPYNGPVLIGGGPVWKNLEDRSLSLKDCKNSETDPSKTGTPDLGNRQCSQVAYTYEDQVFPFVDGVCYKILRKWTVIDWCKFAPNLKPDGSEYPRIPTPQVNSWTYTQVIKVSDTAKPKMANPLPKLEPYTRNDCTRYDTIVNSATDCSKDLKWSYTVRRENSTGTVYKTGTNNDASGIFPVGNYHISWTVEDYCGNDTTSAYTFMVPDNKKPTPYCLSQLTTVVMPSSGDIEIWAKDFDRGSFDNCPVTGCGLKFTFNGFVPGSAPTSNQTWLASSCSSAIRFRCSDFPAGKDTIHRTLKMYVWDEANNFDFCDVTLILQKNSACAGSAPGRIAGDISTDKNEMIKDVNVTLRHLESQETTSIVTDQTGRFEFGDMKTGKGYNIIPEKNDDHLNGVSTLDLVMMQRHILDIEKLNSPYKYIAADVNRDNKITAGDLVELRKLILGIYASLPNNTSWRFIDKSSQITDPNNPWNINEYITLPSMSSSSLDNHFMGIKTGDINGSVVVNANSTKTENRNKALTLQADNKEFMPGQKVRVDFTSDNFTNITGAQWTLNFDASALEYADLISGAMVMGNENINTLAAHDGKIAFSWNDFNGMTVSDDKVLFSIEFRATTNNTINKTVSMSSDITKAEAYTTEHGEAKMNLNIRSAKAEDKIFTLGQNNPNPFTTNTTISFNLPEAGHATLTIYDITGKVLKSYSKEYVKGRNEVIINSDEINAQGVMFYELESNGVKATKKMIYLSK
jgi:hypothetical protein